MSVTLECLVQTRVNGPYCWALVCNFYRVCLRKLGRIEIGEKEIYASFSEKSCSVQKGYRGDRRNILNFYTLQTDLLFERYIKIHIFHGTRATTTSHNQYNHQAATMPITDISKVQSEKVMRRVSQMWWRINDMMSMHNRLLETYWAWPAIKVFLVHHGPSH